MSLNLSKDITQSSTVANNSTESCAGWELFLADVQAQIAHLRGLVPVIKERIASGDPWPGMQTENQLPTRQHDA